MTKLWNSTVNADGEPAKIYIEKGSWTDSSRENRVIPYKVYTPEAADGGAMRGPLPLIVWSHGLGGSREGAGFISRYISSHGYIVVHIQHDGTDSSLWEGKPGHPWDVIRATHIPRRATLQRLQDVPFALDQIAKLPQADLIDFDLVGMSGHSFGAMTTQVMAGQYRGHGKRRYSLFEPRFKAGILYSPGHAKHPDQYTGIRLPLLAMTGTDDDSPLAEFGWEQRREVFDLSGAQEQHLVVMEGGDHMVYNGSRGKLGINPKRDIHERIIRVLSLAFWEAYLKGDKAAYDWLSGEGVRAWLGAEATYTYRA